MCIIHNAYIKFILISNIFYLFWRARKMRGHPVTFQNSGNTFVVCFSDIFEIKKSSRISEIVLWGVVFREKNFFCFDFDFALGNFDTKSILNFGFTKLFFDLRFRFYKKYQIFINFKITDKFIHAFPSPIIIHPSLSFKQGCTRYKISL